MLGVFRACFTVLDFTKEDPVNGNPQFLDLVLLLQQSHVCWCYAPRSKKCLLPYSSIHSKVVKIGIVFTCFRASLSKSSPHRMVEGSTSQANRLKKGGYPSS